MDSEKKITIYDIAREAGISASQVSRAISGRGYVSEENKAKIDALVKKYNYRPNVVARTLDFFKRSQTLRLLYVILPFFGEGNGTPLQYSCLENPVDGGAWKAAVHGVADSRTQLSDFAFTFHFHELKEMATHSSVPAWRIPGTGEPGGLPSMGSQSRTRLKRLSSSSKQDSRMKVGFYFKSPSFDDIMQL